MSKGTTNEMISRFESAFENAFSSFPHRRSLQAVVGIPIFAEFESLSLVIKSAADGLERSGLSGKSLIACAGPGNDEGLFTSIHSEYQADKSVPLRFLPMMEGFENRGWSICALMKIALRYGAPLVILTPAVISGSMQAEGDSSAFPPAWIESILAPVSEHGQDLALANFRRPELAHPIESVLSLPVMAGVFGLDLRQPTPGVLAVSPRLMQACTSSADVWSRETGIYGFEPWLVTRALTEDFSIAQVHLGINARACPVQELKRVFHQVAHALMHQVVLHARWWTNRPEGTSSPRTFGYPGGEHVLPDLSIDKEELLRIFEYEFNRLDETLLKQIVPERLHRRMEEAASKTEPFTMTAKEWIDALKGFLLLYGFEQRFHPDDLVDGLFLFFVARLSGFIDEIETLRETLGAIDGDVARDILHHEVERMIRSQSALFVSSWFEFREEWHKREIESRSYLPKLGAWEFVPNVGVIVPQEISAGGKPVARASEAYQEIIGRYREEFTSFVRDNLATKGIENSLEITSRLRHFWQRLETAIRDELFPFKFTTMEGIRKMGETIFAMLARADEGGDAERVLQSFQLTEEAAGVILKRNPPQNLFTQNGARNLSELTSKMSPLDALCLASLTESGRYVESVLDFIEKNAVPDWFHEASIEPVYTSLRAHLTDVESRGTSGLVHLTGRIPMPRSRRGWGGEFPVLQTLLGIMKERADIRFFSRIWSRIPDDPDSFAATLVRSIRGYWGRMILSAYNAAENLQHREVARTLLSIADELRNRHPAGEAARLLTAAGNVYHLSITLPDTTFVPMSAWTWASYSAQGGTGAPPPLFATVERDWATIDFITLYMAMAGLGDFDALERKTRELVSEGKAWENLRDSLLGMSADPDSLMVLPSGMEKPVPAGKLVRLSGKPILEPVPGHPWESRYVFNPAAVRIDGATFILYRSYGDDGISRIGLAWTKNGVDIEGRMDKPIFESATPFESAGCEDPRVTLIGDRLYMLYTAWDEETPQIAMASIDVEDFLKRRFDKWTRDGLGFPGLPNKDAVLYPETFEGRYVVYHRIDPDLWISYLEDLVCPWPRTGQKILAGPRPGMMWDGVKIGAGAPPIKTRFGWLNIYHGVDYERSYRLGVLVTDLNDPSRMLYRSPNPVLEPEAEYEIGEADSRDYWVPHVVFTCGAVPALDKEILDIEDEIIVYYGAADTVIGAAKGKIGDLVPFAADIEKD
jgi:predicted GH43/DUF377 family glycosyl hydrolase